jgi:hypothetical protein
VTVSNGFKPSLDGSPFEKQRYAREATTCC